ncbi:MAG: hypothetical protein WDZ31_04400 [Phycisphaeraceae bacterium]
MFPVLSQRLLIPIAALVGGMVWMWAAPAAMAADGSEGISLFDGQYGVIATVLLVLLAALPAIALATVITAMGNPISGVFVLGVAMMFPAIYGGRTDGWLWRWGSPSAYWVLLAEMLVWAGALLGVVVLMEAARPPLRRGLPRLATEDHFGPGDLGLRWPDGKALIAGLICAGVGGALATLLLAVSDTGQVMGALILAFGAGAVLTQSIVPQSNPLPMLLAPALLGMVAYAYVPLQYTSPDALYAAWYDGRLWGPAMALPIHYAAAGLVGVTLGLGLAQAIDHSRVAPAADTA